MNPLHFRPMTVTLAASLAAALFATACAHKLGPKATPVSAAAAAATPVTPKPIPDRPEQLVSPPLKYEVPRPADYRVQLQSGPVAYVAADRELPLVNLVIAVRTGQYLEPAGKEGLADLTGYLLARGGADALTAEQLEERLAYLAANLESGIGDTQGMVSLNLLSKDLDEGLALLRSVLTAPRFQDDKIALRKQQLLQDMKQRNDDSANIEARERNRLALGDTFWVNHLSTAASLDSITRSDIESFHRQWFVPRNFVVAASGDFDRAAMIARLESLFANWPFPGDTPPAVPTNTVFAPPGVYLVDKPEVNQGRVSLLLPGITRDDPDYFAVTVMNDILGGGGFSSRILTRVRSDEGLAYSAGSRFPGGVYFPAAFTALFQSKSRTVAYATSIVLDEMKKMAAAPVAEKELNTSQRAFIERFPRQFDSKAKIVSVFASDELTGRHARDPEFWQQYRPKIAAVTRDDVQRVARKYLLPERAAILVVGNRSDILLGHPDHAVKLTELSAGRLVDVPLLDPLTLQPLPRPPAR